MANAHVALRPRLVSKKEPRRAGKFHDIEALLMIHVVNAWN